MANKVQGKHAAGAQVEAPQEGVPNTEGIGKDANGNTVVWTAESDGTWTPVVLKKKRHPWRIVAIVLLSLIALVGAVYAGGWWYFSNHLFPNTTLAGNDLSYKTNDELVQIADSIGSNYTMVVKGEGVSFTVAAKDVAAGIDGKAVAAKVITNDAALRWPLELTEEHDISQILLDEFDTGDFEADLRKQVEAYNETAKAPENAFIEFDAEAKLYAVHPETPGTKLKVEPIVEAAQKALVNMETEATIPEGSLVPAEILSTDEKLNNAVNEANNYCKANLDLVLGDTSIHATNVDSAQISQWVSIDEDYKVQFDEEAMNRWVEDLANSLNTVGTERPYVRPSDGAEYMVSGGIYGWEIDNESLISQVSEGIRNGFQGVITVPTFTEGYTWNGYGQPDWGAVMDVDLSEQYARYFDVDGNILWESAFISGIPDGKHDTPVGVWRVLNRESPATLKGEIMAGTNTPEYETKVQYWMPFTYQGHGFHDATWQWAFGGNSYAIGYGSHGCINLPYSAAESLYTVIQVGNAVIVHW